MTPRSIRRAAEREAKKAALKAQRNSSLPPVAPAQLEVESDYQPFIQHAKDSQTLSLFKENEEAEEFVTDSAASAEKQQSPRFALSAAQLAANRANAQLSSGPNTPEGKAKSCLNAVKTALTGRTVLLPSDDAAAYEHHLRAYADEFRPVGLRESDLVQSIADTAWRLRRIPALESAIFAQGYIEFADAFNQHAPELRASMIDVQTFITYERQLRNLQLQEARLVRRREKEMAELRQLQQERRSARQEALDAIAKNYASSQKGGQPFEPVFNGFVFSTAEIEQHLERLRKHANARTPPPTHLSHAA